MHTITRILLPRCDHFFAIVVYLTVEGVRLFEFEIWKQKYDFWQRTFYSFEKIFDLNHQKQKIIWKKMMQDCFEIKKQTLSDVYLINLMFFAFIGHRHLNISFFKKEQNCNSFSIFCPFLCIAQYCKHLYSQLYKSPHFISILALFFYSEIKTRQPNHIICEDAVASPKLLFFVFNPKPLLNF